MAKKTGIPKLRRHKPSKRAMVRLNKKDHYLGPWPDGLADPPPAAQAAYDTTVSRWLTNQRRPLPTANEEKRQRLHEEVGPALGVLTVAELAIRFADHARRYYVKADGSNTSEYGEIVAALRPFLHAFGPTPAKEFGPSKLKAVRQLMLDGYDHPKFDKQPSLSRKVINARSGGSSAGSSGPSPRNWCRSKSTPPCAPCLAWRRAGRRRRNTPT